MPGRVTALRLAIATTVAILASADHSLAALIVNSEQPITERVTVQVIQTASDGGTNAAPLFGTAPQQAIIFGLIDTIWAQAGIDIDFRFRVGTYNSSFALNGTVSPRPQTDLNAIVNNANVAGGVLDFDPTVVNLFVVRVVPGFAQQSDNVTNGLAFINGNGIALWAGPNLPSFAGGQEVIASVLAHEIGHNLGLPHTGAVENLMEASAVGERLNAGQISTARGSSFSVPIPIPEPATWLLMLLGATTMLTWHLSIRKNSVSRPSYLTA